jgi:hypothetical protein
MVPSDAFHVTALLVTEPETVAVKATVAFVVAAAEPGVIATEVTVNGAAVVTTKTDANLVGSATLVAVIMCVPGLGAV